MLERMLADAQTSSPSAASRPSANTQNGHPASEAELAGIPAAMPVGIIEDGVAPSDDDTTTQLPVGIIEDGAEGSDGELSDLVAGSDEYADDFEALDEDDDDDEEHAAETS